MKYTFPFYILLIPIAISVIALVVGILLLRAKKPLKFIIIAFSFSALAGGIFAPMMAMDRVILDDLKLEQTTGFWFAPTVKGFRLEDVSNIRIGTARDRKNREYEIWTVHYLNSQTEIINPGDLWEINGPDIIERLHLKGIDIK
jgi:hypothetical protein